jgi:hypothetical protein
MGLRAWEEIDELERLEPLDRGKLAHEILERFMSALPRGALGDLPPSELTVRLQEIGRTVLENGRPLGMPDLLWELECESILGLMDAWLHHEVARASTGLVPALFEQPFGKFSPESEERPLRIQAGKYAFEFRGRIDRADISKDRSAARVLDYKTGALPPSMTRDKGTPLMAGERVQLVVYRAALPLLPGFEDARDVQGEYLHLQVKDGQVVPKEFSKEDLDDASDRFPRILEIIGDGLTGGMFFPRTSGIVRPTGHCTFCDFLQVCGKDRIRTEERKSDAPEVLSFAEMRRIDGLVEEEE